MSLMLFCICQNENVGCEAVGLQNFFYKLWYIMKKLISRSFRNINFTIFFLLFTHELKAFFRGNKFSCTSILFRCSFAVRIFLCCCCNVSIFFFLFSNQSIKLSIVFIVFYCFTQQIYLFICVKMKFTMLFVGNYVTL